MAFAYGFRVQIRLVSQREMNNAPLVAIHRPKDKRRTRGPNLARGVVGHCPQLSLAGRTIIVSVADDPLALWQTTADGLVENLLKGIEQLTTLIQQQAIVCTVD
ncbi:MAG TPA: hypothetical protein VIF81_06880 [Pyrinomonadaceae bacterium]|jgi:hypothetical protein